MKTTTDKFAPCEGVPLLHNFAQHLWKRAVDTLSDDDLRWFAQSECIAASIFGLADVSDSIAGSISEAQRTDSGSWDVKEMPAVFFTLAETLRGIGAAIEISDEARSRLMNKTLYSNHAKGC
jgi:hypothetical protein